MRSDSSRYDESEAEERMKGEKSRETVMNADSERQRESRKSGNVIEI